MLDFHLSEHIVRNDYFYKVIFEDMPSSVQQVRPSISSGEVYIHDWSKNTWIGANNGWGDMPILIPEMYIKTINLKEAADLLFTIKDTKTGELVHLNAKKVYSYESLSSYVLHSYQLTPTTITIPTPEPVTHYFHPLFMLVFLPPILFFIIALIVRKLPYAKKVVPIANIDVVYLCDFFYPWGGD